jgi:hypothetical protein
LSKIAAAAPAATSTAPAPAAPASVGPVVGLQTGKPGQPAGLDLNQPIKMGLGAPEVQQGAVVPGQAPSTRPSNSSTPPAAAAPAVDNPNADSGLTINTPFTTGSSSTSTPPKPTAPAATEEEEDEEENRLKKPRKHIFR